MNQPPRDLNLARRLEQVCDRFEAAWRSGTPRIEDHLEGWISSERAMLLRELVQLDADYRRRKGETRTAQDYLLTFPDLDPDWLASALSANSHSDAPGHSGETPTGEAATWPGLAEAPPIDLLGHPRYRVVRLLGQGGMGAVYQAEHLIMGRTVALKVIHPRFTSHQGAVERFRREVRSAARLSHPNIVTAYDAEQAGSTHFLVMEYVEGQTLAEYLKKKGPLPAAEACDYVRQAALGLQYAHEQGFVHRDVKPDNLMLARDGTVKILDFGLARVGLAADVAAETLPTDGVAVRHLTETGTVMGTPDYVAPEQVLDAHTADVRADLYALGCSLYQLLAGRVPFPGGDILEKLERHASRRPTPLGKLRRDLPPGLPEVVARLMAKQPRDRYQTPAAVAAALAPFAQPRKKRLGLLVLAGGAAVCLVLFVWAALSQKPRTPTEKIPVEEQAFEVPAPAEFAARPSPADALKRENLSPEALASAGHGDPTKAPAELVAVFGEPRWRLTGNGGFCDWRPDGKLLAAPSGHDVRIFDTDGRLVRRLVGHTDAIIAVRFSPDGKSLASVGHDRTVRLWDVGTGRSSYSWGGFLGWTWSVAFNADGSALAATSRDGTARVWDTATGEQLQVLRAGRALFGVAFTPNGESVVAAGNDGFVLFWSVQSGRMQRTLRHAILDPAKTNYVLVTFSRDGKRMAIGSGGLVSTWDMIGINPRPEWRKQTGAAGLLAFSPDSKSLWTSNLEKDLSPTTAHAAIRWDAETGAELARMPVNTSDTTPWQLSPDGRTLAGRDYVDAVFVRLVDTATGKVLNRPSGHIGRIAAVAFSPDGKWLASGGNDNLVYVWDLATGKERLCLSGHTGWVFSVAFSPDSRTLASASFDHSVRLWDATTGGLIGTLPHPSVVESVAFSPNGERMATGCQDRIARVWDLASRTLIRTLVGHTNTIPKVRFDRTGRRLAACGWDGTVRVWDIETERQEQVLRGHGNSRSGNEAVRGLASFADNRLLATTGNDGTVRLWPWRMDGTGGTVVFRAGDQCSSVAAGPDGRLLAACGIDGNLYLHDRTSVPPRQRVWRLFGARGGWLFCVVFSPEGRYLATANPDGTVYLLRLAGRGQVPEVPEVPDTLIEERAFDGHTFWISNIALSPDGTIAWTAGGDNRVLGWGVADLKQVRALSHPTMVQHVVLSPDGKSAVTASLDGLLRLWRLDEAGEPQVWKGHNGRVDGLAWSADGLTIASGSADASVRIWDAKTGETRAVLLEHAGEVWSVALHKDGRWALSSDSKGKVVLWDLKAEAVHRTWTHEPPALGSSAVCFAPDGKRAAWGAGDGTVRVYDLEAEREVLRLDVGRFWTRGLAFSPNSKRILAGGWGVNDGCLVLFDAVTGLQLDRVRFGSGVTGIVFIPDGTRAVVSHSDGRRPDTNHIEGRGRVWRIPGR